LHIDQFEYIDTFALKQNENVYIYGNYTGHQNMLFKYNGSNMVYSQYYSDLNIDDLYISNTAPDNTYKNNMILTPFSKVLWYDTVNNEYIIKFINSQNNIVDISSTLFNINEITLFISNSKSRYRGQTFYLTNKYLCNRVQVVYSQSKVPIYYPPNTRLIMLTNPLRDIPTSTLSEYNGVATQPFLAGDEWYTKVFYHGSTEFMGRHSDMTGQIDSVFNDIDPNKYVGGMPRYNKFEAHNLFFSGMKGLQIPYTNIKILDSSSLDNVNGNIYDNTNVFMKPFEPEYYQTTNPIIEDYLPYLITDTNNRTIYGEFVNVNRNIYDKETYYNNKFYDTAVSFVDTINSYQYPYVIVKGLYFGYGGHIQERHNKDDVNTIVNNNLGFRVNKITQIGTTQYIYTKLPLVYTQYFNTQAFNKFSKSNSKARNRMDDIPFDLQLNYLDTLFTETNDLYKFISLYGEGGRIVKKNIVSAYDLNPNNYVFLVIPNLNHIKTIENYDIKQDPFAKILLPGDSNRVLYNTYVSATKVYYDYLFNNLNQLEIAFITNSGNLFDFSGSEHSMSLEITEIIDKLEYINPKYGNIEF
jgi:hypothetical protein